jgi:hypothetical protein
MIATAHHQETWDPNWNMRTLVMALRGHILTQPREIGGILTSAEHQQKLAILSRSWICPTCGIDHALLTPGSVRVSKNDHSGIQVDMSAGGSQDVENFFTIAESAGIKELDLLNRKFRKMKIAKSIRQKKQRVKIMRSLVLSVFVGFAVFFFQFCFITGQNLAGKAHDLKTAAW